MKRSKPHPPHTGGTFHRRLQPLYTEKYKVSCSGFLPKKKAHATFMQPLQCVLQDGVANPHASTHMASPDVNNHAAIPMRSATTGSRNAWNYAHRNNHSLQNTEEEPIDLETIQTAPACIYSTWHHQIIGNHAATSDTICKNAQVSRNASGLPPQNKAPCNIHAGPLLLRCIVMQ